MSAQLEEVIVTAQKREQSLQDVPISVQVVSGEDMAARKLNEVQALTKVSPGFTFGDGTSAGDRTLIVRGVGTQTFSRGVEQSVSLVLDGAVATSVGASLLDLNDIARIEILRGPQGMLFGKNASAGVLNVVTNGPTDEFEAILGASYADGDEIKLNAIISGPLTDRVSGRLSYHSSEHDPILGNNYPGGPDYDDRDEWGLRGKLHFDLTDKLDLLVTANHIESDVICCNQTAREFVPGALGESLGVPSGKEEDTLLENDPSLGEVELDNIIAEFTYDWNDYTLTSITTYSESDEMQGYRGFNLPVTAIVGNISDQAVEQFTQEFRLLSPGGETFDWLVGVYYFNKELERETVQALDPFAIGLLPFPGFVAAVTNDSDVEWESFAVFGQGTWHINERARLTAGLRVNYDDLETATVVGVPVELFPDAAVVVPIPGRVPGEASDSSDNTAVSGRLIFEYDLNDDIMLYLSAAQGYKGEGANTQDTVITADEVIVAEEIATNFELGMRSTWANGKVIFNATLFHSTFEDFQATITELGVVPNFFLANAEEMETQGLETELSWQATDNLFLSAALAYVDAEYTDFEGAPCYPTQSEAEGCIRGAQDLSGEDAPNSPEWSYNVSLRYNQPLASMPFDGFINADWYWQDEVQYFAVNDPKTVGDAYGVADASIGITADDGSYTISIFAKNLFDEFHVTQLDSRQIDISGARVSNRLGYGYERRVGISAEIRF
ncbi:MAG: TonB-dependent receptor [Halieaceae bacterium]|nr:TonB-dependent receptor [Halieaceae bacterium]